MPDLLTKIVCTLPLVCLLLVGVGLFTKSPVITLLGFLCMPALAIIVIYSIWTH